MPESNCSAKNWRKPVRNPLILMLLCSLPMIHGCGLGSAAKIDIGPWATQDLAPVRCPPVDQRTAAEFKRTTKTPAGEVTKRGSQEWLDAYAEAEQRKNAAGQRLVKEYESCRSGGGTANSAQKALGTS